MSTGRLWDEANQRLFCREILILFCIWHLQQRTSLIFNDVWWGHRKLKKSWSCLAELQQKFTRKLPGIYHHQNATRMLPECHQIVVALPEKLPDLCISQVCFQHECLILSVACQRQTAGFWQQINQKHFWWILADSW